MITIIPGTNRRDSLSSVVREFPSTMWKLAPVSIIHFLVGSSIGNAGTAGKEGLENDES